MKKFVESSKGNEPVNAHNDYYLDDENEKVRFSPLHVEAQERIYNIKTATCSASAC